MQSCEGIVEEEFLLHVVHGVFVQRRLHNTTRNSENNFVLDAVVAPEEIDTALTLRQTGDRHYFSCCQDYFLAVRTCLDGAKYGPVGRTDFAFPADGSRRRPVENSPFPVQFLLNCVHQELEIARKRRGEEVDDDCAVKVARQTF